MRWNYRCHSVLCKVLYPIHIGVQWTKSVSWYYAHYHNGKGPRIEKLQRLGFLGILKRALVNVRDEY